MPLEYHFIHYLCRTRHRGDLKKKSEIAEKEQISGVLFF
jgi:hypothetical protein